MKIAVVSDLHFEFRLPAEIQHLEHRINNTECDVVCIAGDFSTTENRDRDGNLIHWNLTHPTLKVKGNHDLYYGWMTDDRWFSTEFNMVGASLWTNFWGDPEYGDMCRRGISDFANIAGVSPEEMIRLNGEHGEYIRNSKCEFVMTHFPPSLKSLDPKYQTSSHPAINSYFINDQSELLEGKKLWICGHTHWAYSYTENGCLVIGNPLGYPNELYNSIKEYPIVVIDTEKLSDYV